nr:MAG TPA: hypothetical protein [Caudoviricetes sp.]
MGTLLLNLLGWIGVIALIGGMVAATIAAATLIIMTLDACGEALRKWRRDHEKR